MAFCKIAVVMPELVAAKYGGCGHEVDLFPSFDLVIST
jgi:hypothetical protein